MCCNNAYVSKNHEYESPEVDSGYRIKKQNKNLNEEMEFEGEMHITDRKDNNELVKHIRTTSSVNRSVIDIARVK